MEINKETKLKDIIEVYPWLKDEISKVNERFKMLNTPMGKVMMGKVTIGDMSKRSGMSEELIIDKINELIMSH